MVKGVESRLDEELMDCGSREVSGCQQLKTNQMCSQAARKTLQTLNLLPVEHRQGHSIRLSLVMGAERCPLILLSEVSSRIRSSFRHYTVPLSILN